MTVKEKIHYMNIAYNNIKKVLDDTDEDLWAHKYLEEAITNLDFYFEEWEF